MIFNKYQLRSGINERGYSLTAIVQNERGEEYFAKWLRGIHKDSTPSRMLSDKLKHLQKAKHNALPQVIEYGWDETQKAYCIIFEYKQRANTLKWNIDEGYYYPNFFLRGILQIVNCLQQLNLKNSISHGDITPENILVDEDYNFYLIDFGITDIATTLSQAKEIEVFAREFAAPEKWNKEVEKGFPYQSDIYSIGKVIEWYFKDKNIGLIDDLVKDICKNKPSDRPNYNELHTKITKIVESNSLGDEKLVPVSVRNNLAEIDFLGELNNEEFKPIFDISPKEGNNILLNIATENFYLTALWRSIENDLHITDFAFKENEIENHKKAIQRGVKLEVPVLFEYKSIYYGRNYFSLKIFFDKILKQKQSENSYRNIKKNIYKELDFYKELIEKELEIIHKNSLRLQYTDYKKINDYEIWFKIAKNEKYSNDSQIYTHIDKSMPPKPEEFEYILSATADKKQIKKEALIFSGTAYEFGEVKPKGKENNQEDEERLSGKILKFKDCEFIDFNKIPKSGYLFENISRQEEEKKRQQEALNKIRNNDVQSTELIHYLFNSDTLEGEYIDILLEKIYQTDKDGKLYQYSYNQQKAIVNAIHRKPLTVIQGPPGTGKTTVITEIVFQILNRDKGAKILITSQTNDAVDNVLDNLLEKNIPLIRLSGVRKPKLSLQKHTLERKIEGWKEEVKKRTKENWKPIKNAFVQKLDENLSQVFDTLYSNKNWNEKSKHIEKQLKFSEKYKPLITELTSERDFLQALETLTGLAFSDYFEKQNINKDWLNVVSGLDEKSQINQKLIDTIRVIGATTSHIAAKKYAKYNFEFDYVIMDESGKATLPESLIPLVMGKNAVLVGDHRQLRPMLTSNKEVEKWLREKHKNEAIILDELENFEDYCNRPSLFENIIEKIDEDYKSQLEECRRMPKDAVRLTSKCFYEVFGDEAIKPVERPKEKEHNLDLKLDSSIIFLDIGNAIRSEVDGNGSSKNSESANLIPQLLQKLDTFDRVKNYSIGVITGYKAQLREINKKLKPLYSNKLKRIKMKDVAVSVVDKFQGLEKDIIIFDLVRSNQKTLGFLANANRINVALSRHKKLLIIVGNYEWLLQAKSHNSSERTALQNYLEVIKEEWRVKNIEQIF